MNLLRGGFGLVRDRFRGICGGFGLLFGWMYRKYGIQYAMLSHALLHIVSKTVWALAL